ncbi:5-(carboxyamino)imidazole ribonucleotide synthase [Fulvivirga sp. M361]|uniref:5-(carboxyamino)imidazole ribonucleotide synthase n=1 Tax=Fulvivirga sp. M361 TaxID=2594266 RepID=UPI00117BB478|nr:5-(carboxyamino)imidazole ribonucleotide synthase [Fulvivirga sp. M361]TRX58795.1 5-(carboxyamino)imidazole ribonucleotide synthase [Fulvivirga sp. M361]
MSKPIQSQKLGILGGGQLGRMLIQSAMDFNIDVHVLDPDENAPCKDLATSFTVGKLTEHDIVYDFARSYDIISIEIENVNTQALKKLAAEGVKVYPQPEVIELIQNKVKQKQFYAANNIPTAAFEVTQSKEDVIRKKASLPMVNKLATEGYDGRGVQILREVTDLDKAFDAPGLVEALVDFKTEIAVIVARNEKGEVTAFPAVEMAFHPTANLVEYLFAPANISEEVRKKAKAIAIEVIDKLQMTGLLAVEMFVTKEDGVLVNEVAPRPHNSGHQTIEANITSQYEQHLRSIFNLPLGDTKQILPTAMVNLLGEEGYTGEAIYEGMDQVMALAGVHVHLYGKKLTKPFRKMGHVTIVDEDIVRLKEKVQFVKQTLKVIAS